MKKFFHVIKQLEPFTINKSDGSQLNKCQIVLQEIGGKYENSYVCNLLGNAALCKFYEGDLVYASLRFTHSEYQGRSTVSSDNKQGKEVACQSKKFYNEITVQDIISFTQHS